MKKVISLFIVFSMVTALITAHASAEGNTFTSVFTPGWSVQGGGSYSVNTTAIFGQSENTKNYYYNFIETPNTNRALMQWKNAGIDEAFDVDSGEGIDYLVFESRFVPSDAITAVSLMTDGSSTTATMPKERGGWVNGHWNSLKIVQSVSDRKTDFYINGVLKYTCTASVFKKGGVYDYRLAYIGINAYTENAVYINDSKLYGVKGENPGADTMPFLDGYNYIGQDIFIAPETKVSSFTSDIYNVRVYEGESFERIREENETAEYGDCLVVEDKSGVFSTFSII